MKQLVSNTLTMLRQSVHAGLCSHAPSKAPTVTVLVISEW